MADPAAGWGNKEKPSERKAINLAEDLEKERKTRLEPATYSLGSCRSTN